MYMHAVHSFHETEHVVVLMSSWFYAGSCLSFHLAVYFVQTKNFVMLQNMSCAHLLICHAVKPEFQGTFISVKCTLDQMHFESNLRVEEGGLNKYLVLFNLVSCELFCPTTSRPGVIITISV